MTTIAEFFTNNEIARVVGERLRAKRLEQNLTAASVSKRSGLNVKTILDMQSGKDVKLSSFIKVLRVMNHLGVLEGLLPDTLPSGEAIASRDTIRKNDYRKIKN